MSEILLEVLKLRKEVAELKSIVKEIAGSRNKLAYQDEKFGIEEKISGFLHELKVPANLKGYLYLREAIKLVYQDFNYVGAFSKELYPIIAEKFNTKPNRVERALRTAIEASYARNNLHSFYQTHYTDRNPTNSKLIVDIADKLMLENNHEKPVQM